MSREFQRKNPFRANDEFFLRVEAKAQKFRGFYEVENLVQYINVNVVKSELLSFFWKKHTALIRYLCGTPNYQLVQNSLRFIMNFTYGSEYRSVIWHSSITGLNSHSVKTAFKKKTVCK